MMLQIAQAQQAVQEEAARAAATAAAAAEARRRQEEETRLGDIGMRRSGQLGQVGWLDKQQTPVQEVGTEGQQLVDSLGLTTTRGDTHTHTHAQTHKDNTRT